MKLEMKGVVDVDIVYVVTQYRTETSLPDSYRIRKVFDDKESAIRFVNQKCNNEYDDDKGTACKFTNYRGRDVYIELGVQEMSVKKRRKCNV